MVSALYRRYRPEAFSELIGQSHVTDPLMAALRTDRVNHAYLFSGPRGCGKTTSARILARCLNCAQGPTDAPCGECPSCVELGRDGGGSIDVIEIDAASHGGVDDARDLRERATLAPNRDRFKIYIIDEAHMVTPSGFNALLKIVEEPPEHVKFIFATTEPEKVIGTIRSRTHHYPFRLIAPAVLLDYVTDLCRQEGVEVEPGVLPMVIRAGGGSARDTLSLLDQLMAGSEGAVTYERAAALLGFTHSELLDDVTAALAARDAQGAFGAVDRVMQAGQDPRRFVEDLLEHLRDLIIAAVADDAESILHGVQSDEIERMRTRAHEFGPAALSHAADTVAKALAGMSGATSPKLQLELLLARLLVTADTVAPAPTSGQQPAAARAHPPQQVVSPPETARQPTGAQDAAAVERAAPAQPRESDSRPNLAAAAASFRTSAGAEQAPAEPASHDPAPHVPPAPEPEAEAVAPARTEAAPAAVEHDMTEQSAVDEPASEQSDLEFAQVADAWPEVLQTVEGRSRRAWMLANAIRPVDYDGEKLGIAFRSPADLENFRTGRDDGKPLWIIIAEALTERFGRKFGFAPRPGAGGPLAAAPTSSVAKPDGAGQDPADDALPTEEPGSYDEPDPHADSGPYDEPELREEPEPTHEPARDATPNRTSAGTAAASESAPAPGPDASAGAQPAAPQHPQQQPAAPKSASAPAQQQPAGGGWAVAAIPQSDEAPAVIDPWADSMPNATVTVDERFDSSRMPEAMRNAPPPAEPEELSEAESNRYGESVIREELGAEFLEEITDEGGR